MSARYFYCDDSLPSSDSESDFQEVQYSSSSIDRSSIGSIPWADDAIKQNQLDWERVERMFRGEEDLSDAESDLRNEILEWHRKFPSILRPNRRSGAMENRLSSLSFSSDDEADYDEDDDDEDGAVTPTNHGPSSRFQPKLSAKSLEPLPAKQTMAHEKLINMLANDLKISSIPMAVRRLGKTVPQDLKLSGRRAPIQLRDSDNARPIPVPKYTSNQFDSSSQSYHDQSLSKNESSSAKLARMPPILKVIEAKQTFRDAHRKHESFVQLTAPNQAQSAAVTTRRRRWFPQQDAVGGQVNKNAIILPSINLHRIHETVPLVGRSISAAFNHRQMSWTYLPYSAAKFKMPK